MATPREERLASNEALFRLANERMAGWEERHRDEAEERYLCECADPGCRARIALRRAEYEALRSNSRHFAVVTGHEVPDVEEVVGVHGDWSIVEKPAELTEMLEDADPRAS